MPIFGAFLILLAEPIKAVWFIVYLLILQQVEGNLIYPKVVGKSGRTTRTACADGCHNWRWGIWCLGDAFQRSGLCGAIYSLSGVHAEIRRPELNLYDPKNGAYEKPYPKKRKPRQLPITPQMDEILHNYLKWRGEQPEWYGDLWQESGYLFTNEYGGPMNPDNITQYLNRMGDRLQKENPNFPHLNPHAFRHAVASILVANGTDIVTTAAFIGDKPATVSERYAHIIDSAKIRAGDTLSSVIFGDGNK